MMTINYTTLVAFVIGNDEIQQVVSTGNHVIDSDSDTSGT